MYTMEMIDMGVLRAVEVIFRHRGHV